MKIIRQLSIVQFMFMGAVAFGQTNLPFQHPRDQIALQLGAIQMGYSVPFQLVGNPTSAQQAANALAMGRNILAATPAKPAVKVQGFVSSPAVDSVEFRDQLYQAVEAVVTTPVIGSIKGSVMLNNGKKQSISATLSLPPITYTIPVPYALESASSLDAQSLATQVDSLSGSVAAVQNQNTALSTEVGSLSGNLTTVQGLTTALSSNVTTLGNQTAAISGNLSSVTNNVTALQSQSSTLTTQVNAISGNMTAVQSQASALSSNVTTLGDQTTALSGNLSTLTSSLTELQNQNAALKQLLMGLDIFTNVNTLAGNGEEGYANGTGEEARFSYPYAIVVDGSGNVYTPETTYEWDEFVGSYTTNKIRKITTDGIVSSWFELETSESGVVYMGQIAADSGGNVYVTETEYVSGEFGEYKINKVRKIAPNGDGSTLIYSEISDFENGDASLGGIAVAASGNVYVTELVVNYDDELGEYTSGKILKILPSGEASTFLDFGPGADEITGLIEGIAVDASENIYVLENLLESNISEDPWERPFKNIRQITPSGTTKIVAKERMNNSDGVMYNYPKNFISVDADGNVYYTSDNRIRKVTPSGIIINMAGRWMYGEGGFLDGPGSDALFSSPSGIIVDANGNVYVADAGNNRIRKITVLK